MSFRRFFWNYKQAFLGIKFAQTAPLETLKIVVPVVLPLHAIFILHKSKIF